MIAALLLATLAQDWQYDPEKGFVDPATQKIHTPAEALDHGRGLREQGAPGRAVRIFTLILQGRAGGAEVLEAAHFERARALLEAGQPYAAYQDFELFIRRNPQSDRADDAKRLEMESALQLAQKGHPKSVLGVSLYSTASTGVDLLKRSLRRYPRDAFSAEYTQKLGMFFYDQGDLDAAEVEFAAVVESYEDSAVLVLAIYMLGRVREQRYRGIDYELKPLREARRLYRRFLEEEDRLRLLPAPAARWVDDYKASVQDRVARINEIMAEKQMLTAEYYEDRDYPRAAALYWKAVVADFPATRAAATAREKLGIASPGEPKPESESGATPR